MNYYFKAITLVNFLNSFLDACTQLSHSLSMQNIYGISAANSSFGFSFLQICPSPQFYFWSVLGRTWQTCTSSTIVCIFVVCWSCLIVCFLYNTSWNIIVPKSNLSGEEKFWMPSFRFVCLNCQTWFFKMLLWLWKI